MGLPSRPEPTLREREAVTFRRTASDLGLTYDSLDFEAAFTIDILHLPREPCTGQAGRRRNPNGSSTIA